MTICVPAGRRIPVGGGNIDAPDPGTHPPTVCAAPTPVPPKQVQPIPASASSWARAVATSAAATANSSTWWTLVGVPG